MASEALIKYIASKYPSLSDTNSSKGPRVTAAKPS